jgi:Fe2+ transport system protein FeoA
MRVIRIYTAVMILTLDRWPVGQAGQCAGFVSQDALTERLQQLGFANGARIEVLSRGWFNAGPLAVRVGNSKFALRLSEAMRIQVVARPA